MRIAIIAAMQEELQAIQHFVKHEESIKIVGDYPAYKGYHQEHEVICTQSGIGKVNAAITTALVIERYQPDYLLNTGIAGGIAEETAIGDVVVATALRYHDVDVTVFNYQMGQVPQMPAAYETDNRFNAAITPIDQPTVHQGLIVSGDTFIRSAAQLEAIRQYFPEALAVDMEACAIGQTCYQMGVPFGIVRSLSDKADEQAGELSEKFLEMASLNAARVVSQILQCHI